MILNILSPWKMYIALFVFIILSFFLTAPGITNASHNDTFHSPAELEGYAWSPNIGWISMNCLNNNECGDSTYKVKINTNKTVSGYAWSANIGWIQFGGLSSFPNPNPNGGVYRGNARVTGSGASWNLEGWARALAYGNGWDGWISLSGASPDYKVSFDASGSMTNNSYAWGDVVIGWTSFDLVNFTPPCTSANSCTTDHESTVFTNMWCEDTVRDCPYGCTDVTGLCRTEVAVVRGELTVTPPIVRKGKTSKIRWTLEDPVDSCYVESNSGGTWTINDSESSPLNFNTNIFTLYCVPEGGGAPIEVDSKEVKIIPTIYES